MEQTKTQPNKIRKNTSDRIVYSPEEIAKMEYEEKRRIFWNKMIRGDGLGGKKGHDN